MTALSAQVLLRSKSGARMRGDVPITSANVAEYAPAADNVDAARESFRAAGFDVGDLVGISFSITAPKGTFESFFGVTLESDKNGRVTVTGAPGATRAKTPDAAKAVDDDGRADREMELPLSALPASLAARLDVVTFTPPADLHGRSRGALTY